MSNLNRPRGYILLAVIIVATALAGCMTPSVPPAPSVPQADEEIVTMFVGPTQVDCVGAGPQQCLLVKEGSADGPYQMFYSNIKGFDYEEGYHYELRVRQTKVENPPADASSISYELVEVVSQEPAGEVSTLYVAPIMVECETTEIFKCLLVADSPDGEYQPFYGKINGFEYEEGYRYSLLVEKVTMDQPPSDAPAGVWDLLIVTGKEATSAVFAAPQQTALEGTLWALTSYVDADGQMQPVLAGSEVSATFQDGRVVGNAGCNNYTASYTLDGEALTIGPAASTMMACISAEVMAQETAYLNALGDVAAYQVTDGTLSLLNAAGDAVLVYAATQPVTLTGTTWEVTMYNNGNQGVVSVAADTALTMTFGKDGQVSGSAGCNNFTGGYTVNGDAITIGPLASTMMMCAEPENIMEQEGQFLAALQAATVYTIHGDGLELRDDTGALQVSATAQPAEAVTSAEASAGTPLEGTLWTLTSYLDAQGEAVAPIADTTPTATFVEGRVSGNASCNNYSADYTVDGDSMQIGLAITTMMMCQPEAVAAQEQAYMAALATVATYQIEGETLTLMNEAGEAVLIFAATQPASLTGTTWEVTMYNNGSEAVVGVTTDTALTMTFSEDGQVSGSAGCNNFTGGYTVDGDAIAIGPLASTMMMCAEPENVMEQEGQFLAALQAATVYSIQGDKIELRDDTSALQVSAVAQPAETAEASTATSLEGTPWLVTSYNNGNQGVVSVNPDTELNISFSEDGQVSGSAGCNNFTGGYTVDGDAITIGPLASTMMMCAEPEGVMEQEGQFMAALQAATVFTFEGDELVMRDDSGALQVSAVAQPAVTANNAPLEGTLWTLSSYLDATGETVAPIEGAEPTAVFADGRVSGNASCNNYSADYTVDGDSMEIGLAVTTMMMCQPEAVAAQEQAYLAALVHVAAFEIVGDTLTLADAEGNVVLSYVAQLPVSLTGTDWQVGFYNNGKQALVSPVAGSSINLLFGEDGSVSGNAGCNNFTGSYTLEGDQLTIGPLGSTMMMCAEPEGIMEQEAQFLAALQSTATYQITGDELELLDANGERTVTASAQQLTLAAGGAPEDVIGKTWLWQNTVLADQSMLVPEDPTAFVLELLPDGVALVRSDCNSVAGGYTMAEDGALTLKLPTEGISDCGVESLSTSFLSDLNRATVFSLADGALFLQLDADAGSMEFARAGASAAAQNDVIVLPTEQMLLTGPVWAWQSLDMSDGSVTTVKNPELYTIEFMDDGTLKVQADCNMARGAYIDDNGSLTIEVAAITRMACPPGSLSDQFIARLNEVATYVMDGGKLYLNLKMDSGNLVFAPLTTSEERPTRPTIIEPTGGAPILGPTWQWAGFQDATERYAVAQPERYTITFLANGKYEIQADCNTGSGSFILDGKNLTIGPAALTRMACPSDSQDAEFLYNLGAAQGQVVVGKNLYITTTDGGVMKLVQAK